MDCTIYVAKTKALISCAYRRLFHDDFHVMKALTDFSVPKS